MHCTEHSQYSEKKINALQSLLDKDLFQPLGIDSRPLIHIQGVSLITCLLII